jgi:hypothetical protein
MICYTWAIIDRDRIVAGGIDLDKDLIILPVILGILFGTIARLFMLRTDYRQYPTYPHGRIIHIALGFIAAFIGSAAVPAVMAKDWSAVTFLGLAAQQFRDVRNMERNTLQELDKMELVPRGAAYIEGSARAFEGRNYLVMFTSIITTLVSALANIWWGIAVGILLLFLDKINMSGKTISHIADIEEGRVRIEGSGIYVDNIFIMNVGLKADRKVIEERAVGIIVRPKNANANVTLANLGQRQAMLHDVSNILGVYRDTGEPMLVPLSKRNLNDGSLGLLLFPQEREINQVIAVLKQVPVLESAVRLPSEAYRG